MSNPSWVIAAPIVVAGKHIGAIIWLSHSRVNTSLLAQSAKASIPPLLSAISQQMVQFAVNVESGSEGPAVSAASIDLSIEHSSQPPITTNMIWHQVMCMCNNENPPGPASRVGSKLGSSHTLGSRVDLSGLAQSNAGETVVSVDSNFSLADNRPVRYNIVKTDSASTHALMRAYQTAIAQHQRSSPTVATEANGGVEEIEVIAKAGQVSASVRKREDGLFLSVHADLMFLPCSFFSTGCFWISIRGHVEGHGRGSQGHETSN